MLRQQSPAGQVEVPLTQRLPSRGKDGHASAYKDPWATLQAGDGLLGAEIARA